MKKLADSSGAELLPISSTLGMESGSGVVSTMVAWLNLFLWAIEPVMRCQRRRKGGRNVPGLSGSHIWGGERCSGWSGVQCLLFCFQCYLGGEVVNRHRPCVIGWISAFTSWSLSSRDVGPYKSQQHIKVFRPVSLHVIVFDRHIIRSLQNI